MACELAIEICGLTKRYRRGLLRAPKLAVADVDMRVRTGTIVGFVGANGAGKTTTLHALVGLLRPDAGTIRVFGRSVEEQRTRARIGFLGDQFHAYATHTTRRALRHYGRLSGMQSHELEERMAALLERFHLIEAADQRVATLSKGTKTRVGIVQALLHRPDILVLDEPTSGLDPDGRRLVMKFLAEQRAEGKSILLSSHILSDLERVCDEAILLRQGRVVATVDLSREARDDEVWEIEVTGWTPEIATRVAVPLEVEHSETEGTRLLVSTQAKDALVAELSRLSVRIGQMQRRRSSLEDLYAELRE